MSKPLAERLRKWDDWVEDESSDQANDARAPFDVGLVLAVAELIEEWSKHRQRRGSLLHPDVVKAYMELRYTAEQMIARG